MSTKPLIARSRRVLTTGIATLLFGGATLLSTKTTAAAQDSGALVDALVRKGVLTNQEAEDVRADLTRDLAQTSAGKIKLSNSVTELKLYGDLRLRYQYDDRTVQFDDGSHLNQQSRYRFRLRLNAEAKLGRDWFAGFALGTGVQSDSEEQTFENGFDDYNIFITKAYLGWQPNDWLTVIAGKQKNPFYTTDLMWDPDITPTGVTETIALHKLPIFGGGSGGPTGGLSKDGKSIAPPEPGKKAEDPWELTLVAGQFIFDDNGEFNIDSDASTDAYLFVEQLIATYKFSKDTSITVAPAFYTYTAADLSGLSNAAAFTDANDILTGTTAVQTTVQDQDVVAIAYSATGVPTRTVTPLTTTTTVQTTVAPNNRTVGNATVSAPRTITSTAVAVRNGGTFAATGAASGLPTDPSKANQNFTTTITKQGQTVSTTNNVGLPAVSGETRQLHILTAPGDISFKLGGIKSKLYWDFAYNFGGRQRFEDIYQLGAGFGGPRTRYSERDGVAWLAGVQFGELKKKGDWQAYLNYRETGIASIDPNLNDSTYALGALNTRGFKLGVAVQLADAVVFSLTGYLAWNLNEDLEGGRATNSPSIANVHESRVLQADLAIKF